jgi:hypothetical protein
MKRLTKNLIAGIAVVVAGLTASSAACAGNVYWSVDVDAPVVVDGNVHTRFSNTPQVRYVQPQPVIVAQAPVVVQPAPVYVQRPWCPPRVAYVPAPPVVVAPYPRHGIGYQAGLWANEERGWRRGWDRHERWEHDRHEYREHRGHRDRD